MGKAVVIVGMASDLAASALGGALIPGPLPGTGLRQARSTATLADCATKNGNTITFTNWNSCNTFVVARSQ